jgi:hypothetical protein
LPCLLLGLECRLGQAKRVTVGVIVSQPNQTDEEMFRNTGTQQKLAKLMNILATKVPAKVSHLLSCFLFCK